MMGKLVSQFPTNPEGAASAEGAQLSRDPYRAAAPRPPSAEPVLPPESAESKAWPPSVSRDQPDKLSAATRAHAFFVRTKRREILSNIGVLELLAKCPVAQDSDGGEGVMIHRDVLFSLGYHLLDKVHELEIRHALLDGDDARQDVPRYDERLSKALDQLGTKDAEIKELRAALGEAAVKIRRLESKIFK